ncbi:MAG: restriction endonuclease subunit S [Acinetobacter sp.]|uniref:restriction endonuclease subunit S n=1 Tax=Acinetobacter sp. TaxID=472 RepID=UPI000F91E5E3|nr:restriction endonuclease subunit S [Acinetobacter sp.]RUP39038.1 MAG: restriction endonuclease subunit S [Acinetobacter sp.]
MNDFATYQLNEIIEIIGGGTPKRDNPSFWGGDIPWLSVVDFNNDKRYVASTVERITQQGLVGSSTKLLNTGDIIISARGTVGCLAQLSMPMAFNQSCYGLRGKNNVIINDYLYYLLKIKVRELKQKTHGAVFDTITKETFSHINVNIPISINVQKKIAKVLSTLDDKIHLNDQLNQTLESIAQAIFKSWFIDFDPVRAKITAKQTGQDPEFAAMCAISGKSEAELEQMAKEDFAELQATAALFPDELVESELGEVPRGWEILDIDKTTSLIIDHRGKTPKKLGADWSDSGVIALSAKHIKDGCIVNREQLRFVDTELYNKWMKEELKEGDILLTSEGPMGEMYYLAFDEKYCLSQRLYALRANTDLISSTFLYFWLLSPFAKSDMNGRATGTTVVGIRQSELRKVKVLTPSKSICDLFHRKIMPNLKQIALNNNESVNLAQIRDILLPKLLTGDFDIGLSDE